MTPSDTARGLAFATIIAGVGLLALGWLRDGAVLSGGWIAVAVGLLSLVLTRRRDG